MPCYLCGTRQVDPDRGESPWARGVRRGHQVLVCPGCQAARDWATEFDRCGRCGSAHLVRRLDEVECRDCGSVWLAVAEHQPGSSGTPDVGGPGGSAGADAALAEEVERALARVLGRSSQAVPAGHSGRGRRAGR